MERLTEIEQLEKRLAILKEWDNPEYDRKRYLEAAKKCLEITNEETCLKIIECLSGL